MAIKHIFPNVNRYCDGSGIRTGFKILVVLLIVRKITNDIWKRKFIYNIFIIIIIINY